MFLSFSLEDLLLLWDLVQFFTREWTPMLNTNGWICLYLSLSGSLDSGH